MTSTSFEPRLPGPVTGSPERVPGMVRRTTNLDLRRPTDPDGPLTVTGRGRDAVTGLDGELTVTGTALVSLTVTDGFVTAARLHPEPAGADALVGRRAIVGWRTGLWRHLRAEHDGGTVLHLLLDDLPGLMVISGVGAPIASPVASPGRRIDVCAGWATGSHAAESLLRTGAAPAPDTRPPTPMVTSEDPVAWHTLPALTPGGMSRRRRIDVLALDDEVVVDASFRDTLCTADGTERVLHEYFVRGRLDPQTYAVRELHAEPRVLPHPECPVAAASVRLVYGVPAAGLRDRVSADSYGAASCTHLNDLMRCLADVPALAAVQR